MLERPTQCQGCSLNSIAQGFSKPSGSGSSGLLVVAEALGEEEAKFGRPLIEWAQAGSLFERAIRKIGINREMLALWNTVACRPPLNDLEGASYEQSAIDHCKVHFDRVIDKYKPRAILALGGVSMKALTGNSGKNRTISSLRGFVLPGTRYQGIPVIPTFHPSYLRRGAIYLLGVMISDIKRALRVAGGQLIEGRDFILEPKPSDFDYTLYPNVAEAERFFQDQLRNPERQISFDTENPKQAEIDEEELGAMEDQRITQIQFSIRPGSGIAFPWEGPFIDIAKKVLGLPNDKLCWNGWKYDLRVLKKHGVEVKGRIDDGMWALHHSNPDIPIGLQAGASYYGFPFPWKHLSGSNFQFYGIADTDAPLRIWAPLKKGMEEQGLWVGYERMVYQQEPILVRMSERGYPINRERQKEFSKQIDVERAKLDETLQGIVPEDAKKIHPPKGYVRPTAEVKSALQHFNYLASLEGRGPSDNEIVDLGPEEYVLNVTGLVSRIFPLTEKELATFPSDQLIEGRKVKRWCRIEPFNPRSSTQVLRYIKHRKHSVPKRLKSADETTAAVELQRLYDKTADPFYRLVLDIREMSTMQSRYLGRAWEPGLDGRVHPTFLYRPANFQFSCVEPNIQQGPERTNLADSFKRMIEAREGHRLWKFDFKSFHALMTGYLAKDLKYMRLSRSDVHSYVAARVKGEPEAKDCLNWPDADLVEFLGEMKKKHKDLRNDQIKHAVHGINFGLTEKGCFDRYKDQFSPEEEKFLREHPRTFVRGEKLLKLRMAAGSKNVRSLYDFLKEEFPRVFQWQEETLALAHRQGFLMNPYGCIRRFWEVQKYRYLDDGSTEVKRGEQADKAIAWLPASNSYCHKREKTNILHGQEIDERAGLINDLHDGLIFETPVEIEDEIAPLIYSILVGKSETLMDPEPFWCGVDVAVGRNLKEMEEVSIEERMAGIAI